MYAYDVCMYIYICMCRDFIELLTHNTQLGELQFFP